MCYRCVTLAVAWVGLATVPGRAGDPSEVGIAQVVTDGRRMVCGYGVAHKKYRIDLRPAADPSISVSLGMNGGPDDGSLSIVMDGGTVYVGTTYPQGIPKGFGIEGTQVDTVCRLSLGELERGRQVDVDDRGEPIKVLFARPVVWFRERQRVPSNPWALCDAGRGELLLFELSTPPPNDNCTLMVSTLSPKFDRSAGWWAPNVPVKKQELSGFPPEPFIPCAIKDDYCVVTRSGKIYRSSQVEAGGRRQMVNEKPPFGVQYVIQSGHNHYLVGEREGKWVWCDLKREAGKPWAVRDLISSHDTKSVSDSRSEVAWRLATAIGHINK